MRWLVYPRDWIISNQTLLRRVDYRGALSAMVVLNSKWLGVGEGRVARRDKVHI